MNSSVKVFIKITKKIDIFFDYISKVCAVISGILLIAVTLIIFAGVVNRAFMSWIWLFVEEYSALALIPMSYLVMGYTLRWNQHLKMDLVVRNVPRFWKKLLGIFAAVFSLICIIFMIMASFDWLVYNIERNVTSSGALRTPLWIFSASILLGLVLFAIDMLLLIINRIVALVYGEYPLLFIEDETSEDSELEGVTECK